MNTDLLDQFNEDLDNIREITPEEFEQMKIECNRITYSKLLDTVISDINVMIKLQPSDILNNIQQMLIGLKK